VTRAERERLGRRGETLAAWYLRLKGWRILARRVKTPRGEVDLVARRGKTVAFVEVKWRASAADLELAIDAWRLRRVIAAAEGIAPRFVRTGDDQRVDVLLLAPGRFPRHIVNASLA
jgi:putative endonuclease